MKRNNKKEAQGKKVVDIKHWAEGDRPRERLLEKGPETLSDAALLATLLGTGRQGKDAVALAREMLSEFDGFKGLMCATRDDLIKIKGMGRARVAQIMASMEIVKRQLRQPLTQMNVIENPDRLNDYLKTSMGHLHREEFRILYLNPSRHLISEEVLFKGAADMSVVDPTRVLEAALRKKASALILVHSHPTGLPLTSDVDIQLTKLLVKACLTVDIPILDHVVIGSNSFWSMKRHYPQIFEGENDIA